MDALGCYRQVWCVDFEFHAPSGHRPTPLCVCARELRTGRAVRHWLTDDPPAVAPYPTDAGALFVAYYASAELGCHLALGWPLPARVLDLYAEFRLLTNGGPTPHGSGLLGALAHFRLDGLAAGEKDELRALAIRGGPFTAAERAALLDYCAADVDALARLLPRMAPRLDLSRALLRGRYMTAAARMEWTGVPIDAAALAALREHWSGIKERLVRVVDADYRVFAPTGRQLDPASRFGAAVIDAARQWELDPDALAAAADHLHREEVEATAGRLAAVRAARAATGLTSARVGRLLDAGRDHLDVPGLDVAARELAGELPDLGIGGGYDPDGVDDDYAPKLWAVLADPDPAPRPRHDPGLIRDAADRLGPDDGATRPPGPLSFSADRWARYLARKRIPWPRLPSGSLDLKDDTFREMAKRFPAEVGPIRDLRHSLGEFRLNELAVGPDGRNRCLLSAFRSRTGRNQPSNTAFIFGPAAWLRSLIRPGPGRAVVYVDWSQQELAIAAALSADPQMMEAYTSGDFYTTFAKMAGAIPADATKHTHPAEREAFKVVSLGVLYGLSADGLARRLGAPRGRGVELLDLHRRTFRRFWEWSDSVEERALLTGRLRTRFGWATGVPAGLDPATGRPLANPRSLRNWPMQAHGAEMMRLAACLATERGLAVCCPVHDAFLIEAPDDRAEDETERMRDAMREASELVLPGFPLRTDAKIVRHPDRWTDARGARMWGLVCGLLAELGADPTRTTGDTGPVPPVIPPPSVISEFCSLPL
ncbi:DNA polymerase [Urbifossiella limnaea]|uniref:DNA-directed DNA polymerase n=1 Tax=Urbifossiella limnaea TaxID=2528023 RepID=A0A517XX67_9BACT|nr:DNA polymerase [Urbifossiella limnaea]QDU22107.1 DNA polymerase I, thermostable [Urbifossiella limnaea]